MKKKRSSKIIAKKELIYFIKNNIDIKNAFTKINATKRIDANMDIYTNRKKAVIEKSVGLLLILLTM